MIIHRLVQEEDWTPLGYLKINWQSLTTTGRIFAVVSPVIAAGFHVDRVWGRAMT